MKELSIEEKAKCYDEALEKAKKVNKGEDVDIESGTSLCEYIFPELKESEDERIKREIIDFIFGKTDTYELREKSNSWLAWLEKQGEQKYKFRIGDIIKKKSTGDIVTICEIDLKNREYRLSNTGFIPFKYEYLWELVEQKPADKVEPKFHEGEWVIDKQGIVHQIANVIENCTNHTYGYDIVGGGYFNDNTEGVRLWTIQDAKPGDVIYLPNSNNEYYFFIFKGIENAAVMSFAHFYQYNDGTYEVEGTIDKLSSVNDVFQPATKEQRESLKKALTDAGYNFDFDEKVLKKVGQKTTWSEEDEMFVHGLIRGLAAKRDIHGHATFSSDCIDITETIYWLESLKDRVQPEQEWSEEDKMKRNYCIHLLEGQNSHGAEECVGWLKSLRPQSQWKPSDEQMKSLKEAYDKHWEPDGLHPLYTLYQDLKKLRE